MNYYDYVLGLIPATIVFGASTAVLSGTPAKVGVIVGCVVATSIIAHSMFVNAPTEPETTTSQTNSALIQGDPTNND